jgi:hypothetical protein
MKLFNVGGWHVHTGTIKKVLAMGRTADLSTNRWLASSYMIELTSLADSLGMSLELVDRLPTWEQVAQTIIGRIMVGDHDVTLSEDVH